MEYTQEALFGLEGAVVIITGGTKGIGREAGLALRKLGGVPVLWGSTAESVAAAEALFAEQGGRYAVMRVDVGDEAQVEKATAEVVRRFGKIDGLVNSAARTHHDGCEQFDMDAFQRVLQINVNGTMNCCKHVGGVMKARGRGSILNISSVRGFQGKERYSAYAASKGAVNMLTRSLGVELMPHGVRVNAIAPCFIRTDIAESVLKDEAFMNWALGRIAAGRLGLPADCVGPILFFLSDASAFCTGTVLPVDGGWLAG